MEQNTNQENKIQAWDKSKKFIIVGIVSTLIILVGFYILQKIPKFKVIPIPETQDIYANSRFQFTISPNNKWLMYFDKEEAISAIPTSLNIINLNSFEKYNFESPFLFITNDCWTPDSMYCVFPIGRTFDQSRLLREIEYEKTIKAMAELDRRGEVPYTTSITREVEKQNYEPLWLKGSLFAESGISSNGPIGYLNNGPDILIDVRDDDNPKLIKQYFNKNKYDDSRITYDSITKSGFTCSDCVHRNENKRYDEKSHGRELLSPNGKYIARQISYGTDWVTPPKLYVVNTRTGKKKFVAKNVYYDMHWTSDSRRLYFYKCDVGGACGSANDYLYYIDLF